MRGKGKCSNNCIKIISGSDECSVFNGMGLGNDAGLGSQGKSLGKYEPVTLRRPGGRQFQERRTKAKTDGVVGQV